MKPLALILSPLGDEIRAKNQRRRENRRIAGMLMMLTAVLLFELGYRLVIFYLTNFTNL